METEQDSNRAFVLAGEPVPTIPGTQYLMNPNVVFDPDDNCQRVARAGYPSTKLVPAGASLSIFSHSNKVGSSREPAVVFPRGKRPGHRDHHKAWRNGLRC